MHGTRPCTFLEGAVRSGLQSADRNGVVACRGCVDKKSGQTVEECLIMRTGASTCRLEEPMRAPGREARVEFISDRTNNNDNPNQNLHRKYLFVLFFRLTY